MELICIGNSNQDYFGNDELVYWTDSCARENMELSTQSLLVLAASFILYFESDALSCYMCPRTSGPSVEEANIECLALGWELSCAPEQDRCYSTSFEATNQVEKGCTQSQSCVGTTTCCQGDFCNADPQNSLTGYGKQCTDLSNCIQRADVMRCDRPAEGDSNKVCLCTGTSYNRGATCTRKSYPDEGCTASFQCLDVNSTCINQLCVCDPGMYSNTTRCDIQKGLGEPCLYTKECRGSHTECNGMECACEFGFLVINGTDSCSGCASLDQRNYLITYGLEFLGVHLLIKIVLWCV